MATETVDLMTEGGIAGVGLGGEVELTVRAGDRFRERRTYKVEEERTEGGIAGMGLGGEVELTVKAGDRFT